MEDENLALFLNPNRFETTTPVHQKREPLAEIDENDDQDSVVSMTCLNDRIPPSSVKRHFDTIKLVEPPSMTNQGLRSQKSGESIHYAPHLTSAGNRNSTDNMIQSSIDVTLSTTSSPAERRRRLPLPTSDEMPIVTIVGPEEYLEHENESLTNKNFANQLSTPTTAPKPAIPSQVNSTPDVQISRFDKDPATSKAAFARSQLAKRLSLNQGQQRSIPIQSVSNTTNSDSSSRIGQQPKQQPDQTAASLAATVAASVAVSVAQPILKLQNDFEQRMNAVLEQIQQQKQRSHTNGAVVPVTHVQSTPDSTRLINDSVDTRMKNMEKLQKEQQQTLTQLTDLVRTRRAKSKSPVQQQKVSFVDGDLSSPPQRHFLDTLVDAPSPPVRLTKPHKKQHANKKSTASPSSSKRPSRVTSASGRTGKHRSPILFKEQPPNSHFNIEPSSPFACSTCDRSKSRSHSRSRSRSPSKGLSPESSYPRPFVPVPRPSSIMSDGFAPPTTSTQPDNALREAYPPFDKYLNKSIPPAPLERQPAPAVNDNLDLHEQIKQIDQAKQLLDESYSVLQRQQNDPTLTKPVADESLRIKRLVEQCVKQVTKQVREEVKSKLEQDELEQEQIKKHVKPKTRPMSKTQLAFDRHSTTHPGKQTTSANESSASSKPYSDAFMESVYGRALYEKIKKEGKQPYFKLKNQTNIRPKQPKQIEQIPVKDTGLRPTPPAFVPPRCVIQQPPSGPLVPTLRPVPTPVYKPEYHTHPDGVILLGPPEIRDVRTFQPIYVPSKVEIPKLTPTTLPSIDIDPASQKKVRFGNKNETIRTDCDDDEEKEEDDGQGIEIPGYHRPKDDISEPAYDGPRFPPTIPHDEGYRDRQYDTLHSGAIDWLEQELIARFMSQLQTQQTTVPIRQHRDIVSIRSSTSSSSDDQSIHDRLLDLLGQDGFQIFVDMGQPIDQDLIQALTREVLEQHIADMIGFHSPRESIHVVQPPARPPRTTTPTIPTTTVNDHHQYSQDKVPTPQPTPPQSPPPPTSKNPTRAVTPEITGQDISIESEQTTPRSVTPVENSERPLPSISQHNISTPTASPSPPPTPRLPPPTTPIQRRDQETMTDDQPRPPPITPPKRTPPEHEKPRTPSPVVITSTSSSSPSSSTTTSFSVPMSTSDSQFSDHMWFEDRSEGQVDLLNEDHPQTELIMRQVQRLLNQRRPYTSVTPAVTSFESRPYSPAGATHTLSFGEVPPDFHKSLIPSNQDNEHTTPTESDESNHSGRSEGEASSNILNNQQQSRQIDIKYKRPSQGYLKKKPNGK